MLCNAGDFKQQKHAKLAEVAEWIKALTHTLRERTGTEPAVMWKQFLTLHVDKKESAQHSENGQRVKKLARLFKNPCNFVVHRQTPVLGHAQDQGVGVARDAKAALGIRQVSASRATELPRAN